MASADDDAVYASILARVERSELREQLHKVSRKECRSIRRHVRHAASSLTALKQLQEASKYLRPGGGDWLPTTIQAQLKSIEEMQQRLQTAVDDLAMNRRPKKVKKRKRPDHKEEKRKVEPQEAAHTVVDSDQDSDVELLQVVVPNRTEDAVIQEVEMTVETIEDEAVLEDERLPLGLVRIARDAPVSIKEEPVTLSDEYLEEKTPTVALEEDESPMELEVFESDESVEEEEELAIELEVPDSDSEDDFSSCMELALKLQDASAACQLAQFPVAVNQLRIYLFESKHLTVTELDGYLFAHKRMTDEEVEEIGQALEVLINVGMTLRARAKVKQALFDLLAVVEQLEGTLGGLPTLLHPVAKDFSSYVLARLGKSVDEPRFTVQRL